MLMFSESDHAATGYVTSLPL